MARNRFYRALVVAGCLAAQTAWGDALVTTLSGPACTPEAQRCLDALATRLVRSDQGPPSLKVDAAIRETLDAHPECAGVLTHTGL